MDKKLLLSLNSGDRNAFKQVFDMFYNALCAFSIKYVPDRDEVEDIIQEVFISFWERKKEFENIQSVKAYLYTTSRNKCLNYLKHRTVIQKHEQILINELESNQFFSTHVIEEETFNQLYAEIRQLPEASQKIMLLAIKGLRNKEIAEKLQISENTVKTQKKIAYSKIKDNMGPVLRSIFLSL